MKYLLQQDGNYYFRRKIPKTSQSYTFSLKSKNAKIASQVISLFLQRAEPLFHLLKMEKREDIVSNLETILKLLDDYKILALEEYSDIEKARHKHFKCVSKKGKERDGGHPKCIKKWLKILEDSVYSLNPIYNHSDYFQKIFKRTGIDKKLLGDLSQEEYERIVYETVKSESFILKQDLQRAKEHFNTDTKPKQHFQNTTTSNKYYEEEAEELAHKFLSKKENKDNIQEPHKYGNPLDIFLYFNDKKYLIDYTAEDMMDFISIIKHLPSKNTKLGKELFDKYKHNYLGLAQEMREEGHPTITLETAMRSINNVSTFLDYAIKLEKLDKNRLQLSPDIPTARQKANAKREEEVKRLPFDAYDLNSLFTQSSWYKEGGINSTLKKWPNRFYIPLLSLFGGMRLNEAAQLFVNDIREEDGIHYFRIDNKNPLQRLKTDAARRDIPIHPKLIELGFLNYVEKVKELGEERIFFQQYHTKGKGYGQALGKLFTAKKFKTDWLDTNRYDTTRETKVFHSFRHTFATRMFGNVSPREIDFIMGHKNDVVQQGYIRPPMKVLFAAITKLDLEGIDFSNLERGLEKINYFK